VCLLVVGWRVHPQIPLVVAANRDERHGRPSLPLHRWEEGIVAGRDREAGGTWLGVGAGGRFASVTNLHPPAPAPAGAPSRGALVRDFLLSSEGAAEFAERIAAEAARYAGFNLVVGDGEEMVVLCSRGPRVTTLESGIHGLANDPPGTPLAKVSRSARRLEEWLAPPGAPPEGLFELLTDRRPGIPEELGGAEAGPRALSPPFLVHPLYGTRSSTVVVQRDRRVQLRERSWGAAGEPLGEARAQLTLGT
jgi:uncharacterized protein with NRDE domain